MDAAELVSQLSGDIQHNGHIAALTDMYRIPQHWTRSEI